MPTSSATVCCGNNILVVFAQGMTIFEIVFTVLSLFQSLLNTFNIQHGQPGLPIFITVWLIYLSLESHGLMKKKTGIIIVGCIIRCLQLLIMISIPFLLNESIVKEFLKANGINMTSEEFNLTR